jgi:hypothetical protein
VEPRAATKDRRSGRIVAEGRRTGKVARMMNAPGRVARRLGRCSGTDEPGMEDSER